MAPAPPLPDQTLAIPNLACLTEPRLTGAASPPPAVAASFPYLRRLSAPAPRNPVGLWPDVEPSRSFSSTLHRPRPPALQTAPCFTRIQIIRIAAVSSLDGNCEDGGVTEGTPKVLMAFGDTGLAILAQATSVWSEWRFWRSFDGIGGKDWCKMLDVRCLTA